MKLKYFYGSLFPARNPHSGLWFDRLAIWIRLLLTILSGVEGHRRLSAVSPRKQVPGWVLLALFFIFCSSKIHAQDLKSLATAQLEEAQSQKNQHEQNLRAHLDILRRSRGSKNRVAEKTAQQAIRNDQDAIEQAQAQERRAEAWLQALEKGTDFSAMVVHAKGPVKVYRMGQESSAPQGTVFQEGDEIETGNRGIVELRFTDGTSTTLAPNTRLKLKEMSSATKKGSVFELLKGILHWELPFKQEDSREVITPTAVVSVRGTELDISIEKNGLTTVRPYEGTVQVVGKPESKNKTRKWWIDLYR